MTEPRILNGRYEVGALIGRGGMADVHHGTDTRLGRDVAIKLLRQDLARDPMFQARFRREAKAVAGLNHPSIVSVYDTGEEELEDAAAHEAGVPYIVMEFVEGHTLRDLLRAGKVDIEAAVRFTDGVLAALDYSHRKGIVHRDIKPANVMVTGDGDVKVMDFGIARALADSSATMTQTQAVVGTAQYLSPEQARGESVDARSDIYSAGCLLYELLAGRPPFVGDSPVSVAYQHVSEDAEAPSTLNPSIPPALDAVVAKALAKNREDRFQSAEEFRQALEAAARGDQAPLAADSTTVFAAADLPTAAISAPPAASTQAMGALSSTTAFATPWSALQSPSAEAADPAEEVEGGGEPTVFAAAPAVSAARRDPQDGSGDPDGYSGRERARDRREAERYDASRKRAWATVLTVAVLLVLAGTAWFLWNWNQQEQSRNATVAVPDVVNMTLIQAQNTLIAANLKPITEEVFDDEVPAGLAVGTDPAAHEQARIDSEIALLISKGSENITLPKDLAGQTEASVRSALEELGLVVDRVDSRNSATVPLDRLIATNPALGSKVKAGSTVDLTFSTGKVTVPRLVDLTVDQARAALADDAVRLDLAVMELADATVAPGTITAQDQPAGTDVAQGGSVTVTVAVAPAEPSPEPSKPAKDDSQKKDKNDKNDPDNQDRDEEGNGDEAGAGLDGSDWSDWDEDLASDWDSYWDER